MTDWHYRWVRTTFWDSRTKEVVEAKQHVQQMVSQGWEAVPVNELPIAAPLKSDAPIGRWHPMMELLNPWEGEVGGLVLYRMPVEQAEQRSTHYRDKAAGALPAVIKNWLESGKDFGDHLYAPKFAEITNTSGKEARENPETRDEILARLEDFYPPLYCATRESTLVEANKLRAAIKLPLWTTEGLRRNIVRYWGHQYIVPFSPGAPYYYTPSAGDSYDRKSRKNYRREWRMPLNLSERLEFFIGRFRKR